MRILYFCSGEKQISFRSQVPLDKGQPKTNTHEKKKAESVSFEEESSEESGSEPESEINDAYRIELFLRTQAILYPNGRGRPRLDWSWSEECESSYSESDEDAVEAGDMLDNRGRCSEVLRETEMQTNALPVNAWSHKHADPTVQVCVQLFLSELATLLNFACDLTEKWSRPTVYCYRKLRSCSMSSSVSSLIELGAILSHTVPVIFI